MNMNLREILIKQLQSEFSDKIYRRGKDYYSGGAVRKIRIEKSGKNENFIIQGRVYGSEMYDTRIFFDFQNMEFKNFECSCPYDFDYCKHSAALGFKFIDEICGFMEKNKKPQFEIFSGKQKNFKQNIGSNAVLKNCKKKINKININNFYLNIYFNYIDVSVNIYKNNSVYNRHSFEPEYFLKQKNALTKEQAELMEYLTAKKNDQNEIDPIILLLLVKKSGMRYLKMNNGTEKSFQILDNQKINIPAKITDKTFLNKDLQKEIIKITLEVNEKDIKKFKIFFGKKGAVLEENSKAYICYMPKYAVLFFKKIKEHQYYFGYNKEKNIEIELDEEDLININNILGDLKTAFNLTVDMLDKIDVKEHKKSSPKLLINYDASLQVLAAKAVIDYGFYKQNVGESVYPARVKNMIELRRREIFPDKNYIIKKEGSVFNWTEIKAKKELNLFWVFYENLDRTGFSKRLVLERKGDEGVFDFCENYLPQIKQICQKENIYIEYLKDKPDVEAVNFRADFKVDFSAENDLLAFDIDCYLGKDKITLNDLKKYIFKKNKIIKKDGKLFKIENKEDLEKMILMLESFYQKENQKFEGRAYNAPELESAFLGSKYYNFKISDSFKKFIKEAQTGRPVENIEIPAQIAKTLRDYQKDGLYWFYFLRKYHFGGILADDMGLGKTLQALSLISMNRVSSKPSLVICPKTLLFNWEDEVLKFFPDLKILTIEGNPEERTEKLKQAKDYDIVIASYPSVKKDENHYLKMKFNYCILDEAQFIKNYKTQSAKTVKKINADFRLALTGTPLENSVSEIWSIFDYLMPGFLGNRKSFIERFENPIMKNSDHSALHILKKKTECFMLRRTKEKVLKELPLKIEQPSYCELSSHQNVLYQEILANVKNEIFEAVKTKGFSKSQIHILAGLTKLRQVCNHPVLLLKERDHEKFESSKLELFLELVNGIISSGRKALVFSQFTKMLDILSIELEKKKICYHYLSGKTKNRKDIVNDFNNNYDKKVFLISIKAGGTGLNLTSADNVIIFDPWWNPSVENQAIDRAHRIGQKNSVNVFRLITKGTIEEKIVKLQEKKKLLFNNLVGENEDLFKKLTWDEVKSLFI